MKSENIILERFNIIGIAIRTSNLNGKALNDIAQLWNRFIQDGIAQQIPNKESEDVYCIYTDYESDYTGEYTTILGCKVTDTTNIPEGFVAKEIPKTNYRKYTSVGKIPDCVGETWNHIWNSDIKRSYIADFDVYGKEAQSLENAKVTTYLSI